MNHHPNVEKTMMNERLLFPSEPSVYHLEDVTVIRLEGPDAVKYLNGQVTCDVVALTPGQSSLGAHCNPKGKVLAAFRLFKREHDLLLLYKKELTEIQLAELKKYAVFSHTNFFYKISFYRTLILLSFNLKMICSYVIFI